MDLDLSQAATRSDYNRYTFPDFRTLVLQIVCPHFGHNHPFWAISIHSNGPSSLFGKFPTDTRQWNNHQPVHIVE